MLAEFVAGPDAEQCAQGAKYISPKAEQAVAYHIAYKAAQQAAQD
ncbi:MAG TPA: hypothetical protein VMY99_05340 [Nevskiaceae bacterium]|nr:hypothetical protein [Nevskiaceae bacterium]